MAILNSFIADQFEKIASQAAQVRLDFAGFIFWGCCHWL